MDLLKEIWERKQRLLQLLQRAKEYGWIDDSTLKAEIKRAEEQKLTIGVIGQMKAGNQPSSTPSSLEILSCLQRPVR